MVELFGWLMHAAALRRQPISILPHYHIITLPHSHISIFPHYRIASFSYRYLYSGASISA